MMKYFVILGLVFLISCSSLSHKKNKTNKKTLSKNKVVVHSIKPVKKTSWLYYSLGSYYKNKASKNKIEKKKDLLLAIKNFQKAARYGKSLDRIYYHISDSYYKLKKYQDAITYAKKSLKKNKKWLKPYLRLVNIYLLFRNHSRAAQIIEAYLKEDPNNIRVTYFLARHYLFRQRDFKKAEGVFNRIIQTNNQSMHLDFYRSYSNYFLGYISYLKKNTAGAILYLHKAIKNYSENKKAVYMLANLYFVNSEFNSAVHYAQKYLDSYPNNRAMHSLIARIQYIQFRTKSKKTSLSSLLFHLRKSKSLRTYSGLISYALYNELLRYDKKSQRIIKYLLAFKPKLVSLHVASYIISLRNKKDKDAFNTLLTSGILLYRKKMYDESLFCFKKAHDLKKNIAGVYFYLGRIHEKKNNKKLAIHNYLKTLELKPDARLYLHVGYMFGIDNKYDEAISFFDKAVELDPKNPRPYFLKGLISIWKKDYKVAEDNIKKAIVIKDNSETYYFYLAIVMEKTKRLEEAIDSLEKAIKYNPRSARSYNYLGYLFAENNIHINRSLTLIQKALQIEPNNGAYIDSLGWVYYRKGKFHKALKNLLKAEKLLRNSPDPVVFDHIGDTYKKLGNVKRAILYWNKAIKIKKDSKIEKKIKLHR